MTEDTRAATSDRLTIRRIIDASPERVYAAWINPALLTQWWGPPGSVVTIVECDIRVGGQYRLGSKPRQQARTWFMAAIRWCNRSRS